MIDATKLVVNREYHVKHVASGEWREAEYTGSYFMTIYGGIFFNEEVTAAIPIPSPETLVKMWEVIGEVVQTGTLSDDAYDLARKLLEQRT